MLTGEAIRRFWESENRRRIADERVFEVQESAYKLVLVRRPGPILGEALLACLFFGGWPLLNWHIYQSPINRGTWIGWVILWCLLGPVIGFKSIYEAWRIVMGDTWTIDARRDRLERNGKLVGRLSQMEAVWVWQEDGGDERSVSRLAIVPLEDEPIMLCGTGNIKENWDELKDLAQRIAHLAQLPIEMKGLDD